MQQSECCQGALAATSPVSGLSQPSIQLSSRVQGFIGFGVLEFHGVCGLKFRVQGVSSGLGLFGFGALFGLGCGVGLGKYSAPAVAQPRKTKMQG